MFFVGLSATLWGSSSSPNAIVGILFLLAAQFFSSTCYTLQEHFLAKYEVNPFQLVGFEGIWGMLMYLIILIIFQNVSCETWSSTLQHICFQNEYDEWKMEDSICVIRQLKENWELLVLEIVYIISIATYNFVGISLTQITDSTTRIVVDSLKIFFTYH